VSIRPCRVAGLRVAGRGAGQVGAAPDGSLASWQAVFLLVGLALLAVSLVQLILTLGKD
jgi:hypothetical protein